MRIGAATTSARGADVPQLIANGMVRIRLWLAKFRDYLLLEMLDILEPRRSFGK